MIQESSECRNTNNKLDRIFTINEDIINNTHAISIFAYHIFLNECLWYSSATHTLESSRDTMRSYSGA